MHCYPRPARLRSVLFHLYERGGAVPLYRNSYLKMTSQIAIVLALLFVALVLFGTERIPIEIVSILLVIALVITNTLSASEAFSGFGNDIVITVAGLFVLTGGLAKTGVVDVVGRRLHRFAGDSEFRITALIMFAAVTAATRYVSLGSIVGSASLAALAFLVGTLPPVPLAAALVAGIITWKHRENIRRLVRGTERRMGAPRPAPTP